MSSPSFAFKCRCELKASRTEDSLCPLLLWCVSMLSTLTAELEDTTSPASVSKSSSFMSF